MKNIKQVVYATVATALATAPLMVGAAATQDSTGFTVGSSTNANSGLTNDSIFNLVHVVMNWLLGLVGVLAVIGFVISGILYLTAAGDEEQAEKAKSVMMYAIIGLVIALIGLVVVNAIAGLVGSSTGSTY